MLYRVGFLFAKWVAKGGLARSEQDQLMALLNDPAYHDIFPEPWTLEEVTEHMRVVRADPQRAASWRGLFNDFAKNAEAYGALRRR
jgi:hypothetical protein